MAWSPQVSAEQPKLLRLNVLLRHEEGCWVARCPEIGTLSADPDFETAWEDIVRLCRAHLAYGMSIGMTLADLVKPPPADIAEIIAQTTIDGHLRLHLKPCIDSTELEVFRMIPQAA